MYEYLDKNHFEVGMQLLGATNKANIRKQYLHLSVKLHPDKDQANAHATERFTLLCTTYEMLQKTAVMPTLLGTSKEVMVCMPVVNRNVMHYGCKMCVA